MKTLSDLWPTLYWFVSAALTGVGGYLGSYLSTKGKLKATEEDLQRLLREVRATTQVAESVKSIVSHAEWSKRELRQLRRSKLEELVISAHRCKEWIDVESEGMIKAVDYETRVSPLPPLVAIQTLYFAELGPEISEFSVACRAMLNWAMALKFEAIMAQREALKLAPKDSTPHQIMNIRTTVHYAAMGDRPGEIRAFRDKVDGALARVVSAAAGVMGQITAVDA